MNKETEDIIKQNLQAVWDNKFSTEGALLNIKGLINNLLFESSNNTKQGAEGYNIETFLNELEINPDTQLNKINVTQMLEIFITSVKTFKWHSQKDLENARAEHKSSPPLTKESKLKEMQKQFDHLLATLDASEINDLLKKYRHPESKEIDTTAEDKVNQFKAIIDGWIESGNKNTGALSALILGQHEHFANTKQTVCKECNGQGSYTTPAGSFRCYECNPVKQISSEDIEKLLKTLGDKENEYMVHFEGGEWWIEHKDVGSGELLKDWILSTLPTKQKKK